MLEYLNKKDIQLSRRIQFQCNKVFNGWFYIFARMFNPDRFFIFIFIFYLFGGLILAMKYLIGIVFTFIIVHLLKVIFDRERPQQYQEMVEAIRLHNEDLTKTIRLRSKEKLKSFPSGDSAQGGLAAIFLIAVISINTYNPDDYQYYFSIIFALLFVLNVMFARIYFFCHYFADTLVGAFIGIAVGIASLRIPLNI